MLTCLEIHHTCLNHGHLLHGELSPVCADCDESCGMFHFLIEYPYFEKACNVSFPGMLHKIPSETSGICPISGIHIMCARTHTFIYICMQSV
jgi:hypothetical protein